MAELNRHDERDHALLSASSSGRWLNCPPSAIAATLYPSTDTAYTREGTLAHEVAEAVASGRIRGSQIETDFDSMGNPIDVTKEMVRHAEEYADYIQQQIKGPDAVVLLEQRLDFSEWVPEGFGTGDCLIVQGDHLDVIDYKYGQGVEVSAIENSQLRLYGLGALHELRDIYEIATVTLHIFQPRKDNISTEDITADDLLAWGDVIRPTAALAYAGEGEHQPGDHCRFCPHAGACPALADVCMTHFRAFGGADVVPALPRAVLAKILSWESMITSWLDAVKERARLDLLDGKEIPGYKLVTGRSTRGWADDLEVAEQLRRDGFALEDFTKTKIMSPAELEKALGKKRVAELVGGHILTHPGAPTVAPVTDKRPAYDRLAEAQNDFN